MKNWTSILYFDIKHQHYKYHICTRTVTSRKFRNKYTVFEKLFLHAVIPVNNGKLLQIWILIDQPKQIHSYLKGGFFSYSFYRAPILHAKLSTISDQFKRKELCPRVAIKKGGILLETQHVVLFLVL